MQLPPFAVLAPIGEDAPASGGGVGAMPAQGPAMQGRATLFQSVFSQGLPGDRAAARAGGDAAEIPHTQASATTEVAQESVLRALPPAPPLASAKGITAEFIERAGPVTFSGAVASPPLPLVSKLGSRANPGAFGENLADQAGASVGSTAIGAVDSQPPAGADIGPGEFGVLDFIAAVGTFALSDMSHPPAGGLVERVALPVESSAQHLPGDGDPAESDASTVRLTIPPLLSPLVRAEEDTLSGRRGSPVAERDTTPAIGGGWNAPADTGRLGLPGMTGQAPHSPAAHSPVKHNPVPPNALPAPNEGTGPRSAAPGAERRSGIAPDIGSEIEQHARPSGLPRQAERSALAIPATVRDRPPAGQQPAADTVDQATLPPASHGIQLPQAENLGRIRAAPGADRRSESAPTVHGDILWREAPQAPPRRAELGTPAVPGIGREGAVAGDVERDALLEGDRNKAVAGGFSADLSLSETRGAPARTAGSAPNRPEPARGVAVQVAEVISTARERSIELKLYPEELGRVSMTLSHDGGALTVALTAERGDTLELMRRHIDLLGQELRQLGYGSVDFTFGDGQAGNGRSQGAANTRSADTGASGLVAGPDTAADSVANSARATAATVVGGMDIRM